jgi:starch synthase
MEIRMPRVLMIASEAVPFAKTGGLADVLGALPPALIPHGWEPAVVLPRYGSVSLDGARRVWDDLAFGLGPHGIHCAIYERLERGVRFFFIECPWLYDRPGLYGTAAGPFPDNHIRFAALCQAAIGVARFLFPAPLLHLHDWQAALAAPYLRTQFKLDPSFHGVKLLYTIHNLEHQGRFSAAEFADLGLDRWLLDPAYMEYFGDINLMKGGIVFSDAITPVSPKYAREIQTPEFGFGLDGVVRAHASRLTGILNGADYSEWSPEVDTHIAARYSAANLTGKRVCKLDLLSEFGLSESRLDKPLLGIVSRLASQKGFGLLAEIAWELLREDVSLVVLGDGEPQYKDLFAELVRVFPDRVAAAITFSNKLAHKIEAGADIFLMPSLFEPCGLNQLYSLRYGTIPVVRATGGLDDSVDETTGFKFQGRDAWAFLEAIRSALEEWRDQDAWRERMRRAMAKDYSWNASAAAYGELYRQIVTPQSAGAHGH